MLKLADYVTQVYGHEHPTFALDGWQRDLCERLEKAFWCARAGIFASDLVVTCEGSRFEMPSGETIDRTEFERRKGQDFRVAVFSPPCHGRTLVLNGFLAWVQGVNSGALVGIESYSIHHSQRTGRIVRYLQGSVEHQRSFPNARPPVSPILSGLTDVTCGDVMIKDHRYRCTEDARQHAAECARELSYGGYECWRYAAQSDPIWCAQGLEDTLDWQLLPAERAAQQFLSPRFQLNHYARAVDAGVWAEQYQGRYRLRAAISSLVFLRGQK